MAEMFNSNTSTDTKIAVLEERISSYETMLRKIDEAIQIMGKTSQNISKMLAVHEEKINTNEKVDDILFTKIDQLSSKMDSDHNIVLSKIQDLEKKVWIGIGIVFCLSFIIQNSNFVGKILTPPVQSSIIGTPHR